MPRSTRDLKVRCFARPHLQNTKTKYTATDCLAALREQRKLYTKGTKLICRRWFAALREQPTPESMSNPNNGTPISMKAMARLEILAEGTTEMLNRPCVDCGQVTGRFCDHCHAEMRVPQEEWAPGQHTPLCSTCDNTHNACHFCRGQKWCTPPPWR